MAYSSSNVLPFEHASKLGHVSIVNDPFIKAMIESFEDTTDSDTGKDVEITSSVMEEVNIIPNTISIDGSFASIENTQNRKKSLSYVKVASLYLSQKKLDEANEPIVDPNVIREIISKNSDVFSTVLPLNNIVVGNHTPLESLRIIVEKSFQSYENGMLYETLRYLLFKKWAPDTFKPLRFGCPFCGEELTINSEEKNTNVIDVIMKSILQIILVYIWNFMMIILVKV